MGSLHFFDSMPPSNVSYPDHLQELGVRLLEAREDAGKGVLVVSPWIAAMVEVCNAFQPDPTVVLPLRRRSPPVEIGRLWDIPVWVNPLQFEDEAYVAEAPFEEPYATIKVLGQEFPRVSLLEILAEASADDGGT